MYILLHSRPVAVTVPGSRNRDESVDVSLLDKSLVYGCLRWSSIATLVRNRGCQRRGCCVAVGVLARVAEIIDFAEQGVISKAAPLHGQHASRVLKKRADEKISKQIHGFSFIATDSCEFVIRKCNPMSSIKVRDVEN